MKNNLKSKIWAILGTLIMIFPFAISLMTTKTAFATAPETQKITLHKKKFNHAQTPIQNTGEVMDAFKDVAGLADVTFEVYDVTDEFYSERLNGASMTDALAAVKNMAGTKVTSGKTDANGDVSFNLNKKKGEQYAVYVFKEVPKAGVMVADSLVVAFPIYKMNANGTSSDVAITGEVHLYPKNVISVIGSMELTKTGTASGELLNGAEFIVSRKEAEVTKYLSGIADGIFTWTTDETKAYKFVTGKNYTIGENAFVVTNGQLGKLKITGFEVGNYQIIETKAPDNAAIIASEKVKNFTILQGIITPVLVNVENDTTLLEKKAPELDGTPVNVGDAIKYQITVNVPKGIADKHENGQYVYTYLHLKDVHHEALSLHEDSATTPRSLKVEGNDIAYEITNQTATGFTVVPNIEQLRAHGGKTLTFTYYMHLNEKADPTRGFTNKAEVENDFTKGKTPEITVLTGGKRFVKVNAAHEATTLAGAEFVVRDGNNKETAKYLKVDDTTKAISWVTTKEEASKFTTGADGMIDIKGLKHGTYYLQEVKAPDDYVLLETLIPFNVHKDSYGTVGNLVAAEKVPNIEKGRLPGTGGNGIVYLLVTGGILAGVAGFYFMKRKSNAI